MGFLGLGASTLHSCRLFRQRIFDPWSRPEVTAQAFVFNRLTLNPHDGPQIEGAPQTVQAPVRTVVVSGAPVTAGAMPSSSIRFA